LEEEFAVFGKIVEIIIPLDFHTKKSKGYCFIEFEDYHQAEHAFYKLHMSTFFGEKIEINYAKSDWKSKNA
jgi:RNA recognition motif-containing protein